MHASRAAVNKGEEVNKMEGKVNDKITVLHLVIVFRPIHSSIEVILNENLKLSNLKCK